VKALISALCALFAALLATTFYVSWKSYDGLVAEDYYGKALDYLSRKEKEESAGLTIRVPGPVARGHSRILAEIATAKGPLRGARGSLRTMRLSGPKDDRTFPLREEAAGVYAAEVDLPAPGSWMFLLAVKGGGIDTERRWIATAKDLDAVRPLNRGIHAGPVAGAAGTQAVLLDISPKPVTAMRELTFTVELPGYHGPGVPFVVLGMPGMRMPPNRVNLTRDSAGRYRGKGVIVRCGSGKRTWTATVILPGGNRWVFPFDVAY
jgi:hypothetical protein